MARRASGTPRQGAGRGNGGVEGGGCRVDRESGFFGELDGGTLVS